MFGAFELVSDRTSFAGRARVAIPQRTSLGSSRCKAGEVLFIAPQQTHGRRRRNRPARRVLFRRRTIRSCSRRPHGLSRRSDCRERPLACKMARQDRLHAAVHVVHEAQLRAARFVKLGIIDRKCPQNFVTVAENWARPARFQIVARGEIAEVRPKFGRHDVPGDHRLAPIDRRAARADLRTDDETVDRPVVGVRQRRRGADAKLLMRLVVNEIEQIAAGASRSNSSALFSSSRWTSPFDAPEGMALSRAARSFCASRFASAIALA